MPTRICEYICACLGVCARGHVDFSHIPVGSYMYVHLCKCIHNVKRNFTDKPLNNVYLCKLTLDKSILQ